MDIKASTKTVLKTTKDAGEIAKKYFKIADLESSSKGGSDFVTKADLEVDQFLRDRLRAEFPDTQFLTEETAPERFDDLKDAENLWIIDPIDGTTNFSRGYAHFAISIALAQRGKVVLGVVYLPAEGLLYRVNADEKHVYCNDKKIRVSQISDLTYASLGYNWAWSLSDREVMHEKVGRFYRAIRQPVALGSAASDIAKVAAGELDGYVDIGIKPWDIAAASLLVTKAGGKITRIDGSTWSVFDKELLATNGKIHDRMVDLLSS